MGSQRPNVGRPVAAPPLDQCAELLGIDLATTRDLAANVEPYIHADGTKVWSLMSANYARAVPPARRLHRPSTDPSRQLTSTVRDVR